MGFEVRRGVHQHLFSYLQIQALNKTTLQDVWTQTSIKYFLAQKLLNEGSSSLWPGPLSWLSGGVLALPAFPSIHPIAQQPGAYLKKNPVTPLPETLQWLLIPHTTESVPAKLSPPLLVVLPQAGSLRSGHTDLLTIPQTHHHFLPQGLCTCSARCLECPFSSSLAASFPSREASPDHLAKTGPPSHHSLSAPGPASCS